MNNQNVNWFQMLSLMLW